MPIVLSPATVDVSTISWVAVDGTVHPLHTPTVYNSMGEPKRLVTEGSEGWGMPPISISEDSIPFVIGSIIRDTRLGARDLDLPVWIAENSPAGLESAVKTLRHAMNPLRGDGTLRVVTSSAQQYEISCRLSSGLTGINNIEQKFKHYMRDSLTFHAGSSEWRTYPAVTQVFSKSAGQSFFPLFNTGGVRLSSPEIFASPVINNQGEVDSWPIWTIKGPGQNIGLFNNTTGEALVVYITLGDDQEMIIDTRPGKKTIYVGSENVFHFRTPDSSFWPVVPGNNNIVLVMQTSDESTAEIRLEYQPAWLGVVWP